MALNPKQRAFATAYIKNGGNASRAAIEAGYARTTANNATDWITKDKTSRALAYRPELRAYIDELLDKMESEAIADAKEVMIYLTSVMRGTSKSWVLASVEGGGQEVIQKRPDENQRLKAASELAKILGLQNKQLDINGILPVIISGADSLED